MTTRTRQEVAAELAELKAEHDRRIDEKIAKGAKGVICATGSEDSPLELERGEVLLARYVTGVPRGDEIVPYSPAPVQAVLPARYNYPTADPSNLTKSTAPAPLPKSAPRKVRVQVEMPSATSMGAVQEFTYVVTGNTLTVSDRTGMPVGSAVVKPDDDHDAAARRVVVFAKREEKNPNFWRRLN